MRVTLLSGPAGVGKTWRCVEEIRACLRAAPEGPPLILLTPKPGTYQLERSLLSDPALAGYTRLQILSFERLASWCLEQMGLAVPDCLDEEGRVMVLRALLARHGGSLEIFRASSRLNGFSRQLSRTLSEFQHQGVDAAALRVLSGKCLDQQDALRRKLADVAHLMDAYRSWLEEHQLRDVETLVSEAARALAAASLPEAALRVPRVAGLWVDGFMDFTYEQLELLAGLVPGCEQATITFCLEELPVGKRSWLSKWAAVARAHEVVSKRMSACGAEVRTETLARSPEAGRFVQNPVLQHLEARWDLPATGGPERPFTTEQVNAALRLVVCPDREQEVVEAAREILRFVRAGGRYREIMVLVRDLEPYHAALQRILTRYEIPFFLDRRETVAQHPLAELTRGALRTVELGWKHEDWFAVLKTGLCALSDDEADLLENETLLRGWQGETWKQAIQLPEDTDLGALLERIRRRVVPPVAELGNQLQGRVTGPELARAVRRLWEVLGVADRLTEWASTPLTGAEIPGAVHLSVLEQMESWLENIELGFEKDSLTLREWIPIVESGLATLSVGVIPPALDQVVIGAIDRSRTPDVALALVLGLNEGVFPAAPASDPVLNDNDRDALSRLGLELGATARAQLGRERYLGYIACTRPRCRLVLTCAAAGSDGKLLNTSALLHQVRAVIPEAALEQVSAARDWRASEHPSELATAWLEHRARGTSSGWDVLQELPQMSALGRKLARLTEPPAPDRIDPEQARMLYGEQIDTSISRMENFAACPFKFFLHSGLRAEERRRFELDFRERGSFLHQVLAEFHAQLSSERLRWRDLTPAEARARIERIALQVADGFNHGLLQANRQTRFMTQAMIGILQEFIDISVAWMHRQYRFDPVLVEQGFGIGERPFPPWTIPLDNGCRLNLRGKVDRIDLVPLPENPREALVVIIDYKSKAKSLEPILVDNGLQLQLLSYLNTVAQWDPALIGPYDKLHPAGVFFAPLQADYDAGADRNSALEDPEGARRLAYQHAGRFATEYLAYLDARPDSDGDQFNFRRVKSGGIHKGSKEAVSAAELKRLQEKIELLLRTMGGRVFAGEIQADPYKRNSRDLACARCDYQSICRIDPATHPFRKLEKAG